MKGNLGYWQRRYIRIHGYDPGIFALAKRAKRVTLSFEGSEEEATNEPKVTITGVTVSSERKMLATLRKDEKGRRRSAEDREPDEIYESCLLCETGSSSDDGDGCCCCCWFRKVILSGPLITRPSQIFKQAGLSLL
uniref:Uncharacterized protein n=1 Tax=Vespula pensylvanica TaxID=30213 RepID=A0A834P198_VESPE|nr:hypothetical protein H0235_009033 [Vespula pensylvanica]